MAALGWIWHELAARDLERSKRFYGDVLGWRSSSRDGPAPGLDAYWIWEEGPGGPRCGGLYQIDELALRDGPQSRWLPYVEVDDVDETASAAEALSGGVIASPIDVPGVGRTAVIADINEAPFAILKPSTKADLPARDAGCWAWHAVATDDLTLTAAFYRGLFGWTSAPIGDGARHATFLQGGVAVAGAFVPPESHDALIPQWIAHLEVGDVALVMERARSLGGKAAREAFPDAPDAAIIMDPDGAGLAVRDAR